MSLLGELIDIIEGLGWNLHDVVAEGAYSQFELDFHYTDVLRMADRFVFLRVLLKEVAKRHGMFVTFMPKTTIGDWRSGAHLNTSIQPIDQPGTNFFESKSGGWADSVFNAIRRVIATRRSTDCDCLFNGQFLQRTRSKSRRF